ncbi:MAG: RlmE family RNA methyltransferase [Candidatus Peribacteraceae bacterium]|nr:RlmE family RNA methyltransferase [Candidatus Peribacteraceae bacterium]
MPKPYIPNDKWSQRAAKEGYRARSVYKLMELDDRFGLIKPGMTVVDLGAAPGSWMQYASKIVGPSGSVLGFDLQEITPVEDSEHKEKVADNAKTFVMDIMDTYAIEDELRKNGVREADLVLADMAPNTSGIKDMDQWKSIELATAALAIGKDILKPNGKCVVKVFRGADFDEFFHNLKMDWQEPVIVEATASRDRSREVYVVVRKPQLAF